LMRLAGASASLERPGEMSGRRTSGNGRFSWLRMIPRSPDDAR
jgi:hypothetical protein